MSEQLTENQQQHEDAQQQITFGILHSAILQASADVRALGTKVDQSINLQSSNHLAVSTALAELKTTDAAQQRQIDDINKGVSTRSANRLSVWGIIMGAGAIIASAAQAIVTYIHR